MSTEPIAGNAFPSGGDGKQACRGCGIRIRRTSLIWHDDRASLLPIDPPSLPSSGPWCLPRRQQIDQRPTPGRHDCFIQVLDPATNRKVNAGKKALWVGLEMLTWSPLRLSGTFLRCPLSSFVPPPLLFSCVQAAP